MKQSENIRTTLYYVLYSNNFITPKRMCPSKLSITYNTLECIPRTILYPSVSHKLLYTHIPALEINWIFKINIFAINIMYTKVP